MRLQSLQFEQEAAVMSHRTGVMPTGEHQVTDARNAAGLGHYRGQIWEGMKDDTKILGNIFFFNKVSYSRSWQGSPTVPKNHLTLDPVPSSPLRLQARGC